MTNDVTTTIGVENSTGSAGTAYATTPANGSAITFTPAAAGPVLAGAQFAAPQPG